MIDLRNLEHKANIYVMKRFIDDDGTIVNPIKSGTVEDRYTLRRTADDSDVIVMMHDKKIGDFTNMNDAVGFLHWHYVRNNDDPKIFVYELDDLMERSIIGKSGLEISSKSAYFVTYEEIYEFVSKMDPDRNPDAENIDWSTMMPVNGFDLGQFHMPWQQINNMMCMFSVFAKTGNGNHRNNGRAPRTMTVTRMGALGGPDWITIDSAWDIFSRELDPS